MAALGKLLRTQEGGLLAFWCPGCDEGHHVRADVGGNPHDGGRWGYNGSVDAPTFTPSVLLQTRKMTAKGEADWKAWCDAGYPKPAPAFDSAPYVCHSFVTNGQIQFLSDCTHALAGKTVPLPEWPGSPDGAE